MSIVIPQPSKTECTRVRVLCTLLPYLMQFRGRVVIAMGLLILAKLATVAVPLVLKKIIDLLSNPPATLALPAAILVGYALLRFSGTLFGELRDALFAQASQYTIRSVALKVFRHLHALSPRFHLARQTGGISRDIERGTRGIGFLLSLALFNVMPTLVEISLVIGVLLFSYEYRFSLIIFGTLVLYAGFTLTMTERRMIHRRAMNRMDSCANSRAIDSLINFETVKYFANEEYEARRYNHSMRGWARAAVRNQISLSLLNIGQSGIIALGVAAVMLLAGKGVMDKSMSIGDLVLINAYVIQICLPLNFLGFVYREIKDALTDTEKMFSLLREPIEVQDRAGAGVLAVSRGEVRFERVSFGYHANRQILFDVSFEVPAGHTVAVVGGSGAGKSTLSRLLFRFYDPSAGRVLVDGQDIRQVTQKSLRKAIGVVPQDTVLFNDTIARNIGYGRVGASREEIVRAAKTAQIHELIESLPEKYDSLVGERGLKLSGGEKQRVSIARAILKNPLILIFDEATSALDSKSEKAILQALRAIAKDRTTLIIAHRLSTVVDADCILVMDRGRIVESGTHRELLARNGVYAHLWALQQERPHREHPHLEQERDLSSATLDHALPRGTQRVAVG
jgi:ABC-type transport system involved in Fe-S cluster assembly fused permease/ATPase subunit